MERRARVSAGVPQSLRYLKMTFRESTLYPIHHDDDDNNTTIAAFAYDTAISPASKNRPTVSDYPQKSNDNVFARTRRRTIKTNRYASTVRNHQNRTESNPNPTKRFDKIPRHAPRTLARPGTPRPSENKIQIKEKKMRNPVSWTSLRVNYRQQLFAIYGYYKIILDLTPSKL